MNYKKQFKKDFDASFSVPNIKETLKQNITFKEPVLICKRKSIFFYKVSFVAICLFLIIFSLFPLFQTKSSSDYSNNMMGDNNETISLHESNLTSAAMDINSNKQENQELSTNQCNDSSIILSIQLQDCYIYQDSTKSDMVSIYISSNDTEAILLLIPTKNQPFLSFVNEKEEPYTFNKVFEEGVFLYYVVKVTINSKKIIALYA